MYKIELKDGTLLENLKLNGNNYISETIIPDDVFKDNLDIVTISENEVVTQYQNMKLIQNMAIGNQSWFILAEKSQQELEKEMLVNQLNIMSETIDILFGGE